MNGTPSNGHLWEVIFYYSVFYINQLYISSPISHVPLVLSYDRLQACLLRIRQSYNKAQSWKMYPNTHPPVPLLLSFNFPRLDNHFLRRQRDQRPQRRVISSSIIERHTSLHTWQQPNFRSNSTCCGAGVGNNSSASVLAAHWAVASHYAPSFEPSSTRVSVDGSRATNASNALN